MRTSTPPIAGARLRGRAARPSRNSPWPSKKPKAPKADKENKAGSGQVATEKDRTAEEPGPVSVFAGEKIETVTEGKDPFADDQGEATQDAPRPVAFAPAEVLTRAYNNIFEFGAAPKMILRRVSFLRSVSRSDFCARRIVSSA